MIRNIFLLLLFSFFYTQSSVAQDDQGYLIVKGSVKMDRSSLDGAKIKILENGVQTKVYQTDSEGKFEARLSLNANCVIIITKQGYFSKRLHINTTVPPEDVGIWTYRFSMGLIHEIEGFDASLLDEPIGKIEFVDEFGDFDYDLPYTTAMQRRIKAMMKEYEKMLKQAYDKVIIQADEAYNNADYDLAEELYDKAIDLDPYDAYPDDQIAMIGKIRKQDKTNEKSYAKYIASADEYFQSQDYVNAKSDYKRALKYKSKEQYPQDQLAWIADYDAGNLDAENELAEKNRLYNEAMFAGERSFNQKQYQGALGKYTEASTIKPEEQEPKDKINELNILIAQLANGAADKERIEREYKKALASADSSFNLRTFMLALNHYKNASQIKPQETYPRTKITEIENILAANKGVEEKYKGFIVVADNAFVSKDYSGAQTNYQQALSIKANEQYPKDKLAEIEAILLQLAGSKKAAEDAEYKRIIAQADAGLASKDYTGAKGLYSQALLMRENEVYPKTKLAEIANILGNMAAKKRTYDLAIARADNEFNIENWEKAKVDYEAALALFPVEQYPQSRLLEIENKLLALKNVEDQLIAREQSYIRAIAEADSLYAIQMYIESKNSYNKALAVKPAENYPKERIADIDNLLAQNKALDQRYATYITSADKLFADANYEGAKGDYIKASQIKQEEEYPKNRIIEIDKLLLVVMAEKAKREEIDAKYNALIQQADLQYNSQAWSEAITGYQQASLVKPTEAYPKQRIGEINGMMAGLEEKDRLYNEAIGTADELFKATSFTEAIAFYNQALSVRANEAYPKSQIEAANAGLAELKKKEIQYDKYIKLADTDFTNNALDKAKAQYQAALVIKPNEAYPVQRISEIDALLLDQQNKMAAQDKLDAQYNSFIVSADESFNLKDYDQAKANYSQALMVKESESYPKERLAEIANILKGLAVKKASYDKKITAADGLLAQKNYNGALNAYKQASSMLPDETYPKEKIASLNVIIADLLKKQQAYERYISQADQLFSAQKYEEAKPVYQQAAIALPGEAYPGQRIAEIDALIMEQQKLLGQQQQLDKQYADLIASADASFTQQNYAEAKNKYNQALFLKEKETYPKGKLGEIDNILKNLADKQKSYDAKISQADAHFNQNDLNNALNAYQQASSILPNETYPKEKINAIKATIAQNAEKKRQYESLIAQADGLFGKQNYEQAKPLYQNALMVLPNEEYPKAQIVKADQLIKEKASKNAQLATQMKAYESKISEADAQFNAKNYELAISTYMDAKGIKGDESYPDAQIAKINQIMRANQQKLEADFKKAISTGDQQVSNKKYPEARMQYQLAQQLKPNDQLPKSKLTALDNLIEQESRAQASQAKLDEQYNRYVQQADNAFKGQDYSSAIAYYKSAQGVKPSEKYPKDRVLLCEDKLREQKSLAAAEEEKRKQAELAAAASSFNNGEFDYSGEKRDQSFLNDLSKKYPVGVTTENYDKPNKKIKRVIVNYDGRAKEYLEVKYSYGTFYFRNGQNISRGIFYSETKKR